MLTPAPLPPPNGNLYCTCSSLSFFLYSSIDRLLDYVPDLIEKVNNMLNKQMQNCLFNILFTFSIKSGT